MEFAAFLLIAILAYVLADWLLKRLESAWGMRLEHREIMFMFMLLALLLLGFAMARWLFQ